MSFPLGLAKMLLMDVLVALVSVVNRQGLLRLLLLNIYYIRVLSNSSLGLYASEPDIVGDVGAEITTVFLEFLAVEPKLRISCWLPKL